jgi:uncharacterized protein YndB with AHSA1/START domain
MTYEVKTEKLIGRPAKEVFHALGEGRLFMNCSADSRSMQMDFRVGGHYKIDFKSMGASNFGEFLEIIPDKKIVFTWCQAFGADQKPDTQVTIELFGEGSKTRLVLVHTGFKTVEHQENHRGGWTTGLADFDAEIENGRLRMVRRFKVPVEKLYETSKNPESFFGYMGDLSKGSVDFRVGGKYQLPTKKGEIKGEFLEIEPNKKIALSWLAGCDGPLKGSHVTLTFNRKDDGTASLELIHDGLMTEADQKAHRQGWETVTEKMLERLQPS